MTTPSTIIITKPPSSNIIHLLALLLPLLPHLTNSLNTHHPLSMSSSSSSPPPLSPLYTPTPTPLSPILHTATCFCQSVTLQTTALPVTSKLCDCTVCQRLHSAPYQWAALFPKSAVRFTPSSLEHLRFYHVETRTFAECAEKRVLPCKIQCRNCGTWLGDEGRRMFMGFPTLFDFSAGKVPEAFLPNCRIFSSPKTTVSIISSTTDDDGGVRFDDLPRFLDDVRTPLTMRDFLLHVSPKKKSRSSSSISDDNGVIIGVIGGCCRRSDARQRLMDVARSSARIGAKLSYIVTPYDDVTLTRDGDDDDCVELAIQIISGEKCRTDDNRESSISVPPIEQLLTSDFMKKVDAICLGPGLESDDDAHLCHTILKVMKCQSKVPLILDSNALRIINDADAGGGGLVFLWNDKQRRQQQQQFQNDDNGNDYDGPIIVITLDENEVKRLIDYRTIPHDKNITNDDDDDDDDADFLLQRLSSHLQPNVIIIFHHEKYFKIVKFGSKIIDVLRGCDDIMHQKYEEGALVGCLAVVLGWTLATYGAIGSRRSMKSDKVVNAAFYASVAASTIVQRARERVFSMTQQQVEKEEERSHVIEEIHNAYEDVLKQKRLG